MAKRCSHLYRRSSPHFLTRRERSGGLEKGNAGWQSSLRWLSHIGRSGAGGGTRRIYPLHPVSRIRVCYSTSSGDPRQERHGFFRDLWSAAARRRFLSFSLSQNTKKESGVEPPHSKNAHSSPIGPFGNGPIGEEWHWQHLPPHTITVRLLLLLHHSPIEIKGDLHLVADEFNLSIAGIHVESMEVHAIGNLQVLWRVD